MFPLGIMSVVIVTLKTTSPVVCHYMMVIPKTFAVNWPRTVRNAWDLLLDSSGVHGRDVVTGTDLQRRGGREARLPAHLLVNPPVRE